MQCEHPFCRRGWSEGAAIKAIRGEHQGKLDEGDGEERGEDELIKEHLDHHGSDVGAPSPKMTA